jgi:hypothetical protein
MSLKKQILPRLDFSGGQNNHSEARDIRKNELASVKDVIVDEVGKLRMMGGQATHAVINARPCVIKPGHGLKYFKSDVEMPIILNDCEVLGDWTQVGGSTTDTVESINTNYHGEFVSGFPRTGADTDSEWDFSVSSLNMTLPIKDIKLSLYLVMATFGGLINGFYFKFGTDASNYYRYDVDIGDVVDGWNELTFPHGSFDDEIGSPSFSTITYVSFKVHGWGAGDNWASDELCIDFVRAVARTPYYDFIANADIANSQIDIYSRGLDLWNPTGNGLPVDLGTETTMKPNYYKVDQFLRISDANFGENNRNKLIGYIDNKRYGDIFRTNGWYVTNQTLTSPSSVSFLSGGGPYIPAEGTIGIELSYLAGNGTWNSIGITGVATGGAANLLTDAAGPFTKAMVGKVVERTVGGAYTGVITEFVDVNNVKTSGTITWANPNAYIIRQGYRLGVSYIYDGKQESLIYDAAEIGLYANDSLSFDVYLAHAWDSDELARVTGIVFYYKDSDGDTWYYIGDVDMNRGIQFVDRQGIEAWTYDSTFLEAYCGMGGIAIVAPPTSITYESRNGFNSIDNAMIDWTNGSGFVSTIIMNRKAYAGGVKCINEFGILQDYSDSIFPSEVNRFDTFLTKKRLDITINDGEKIIIMVGYSDRILQFKEDTLYIINVSRELEYIEDTKAHMGVRIASAVCVTPYGVAWYNKKSLYFYDDGQVIDLNMKDGKKLLSKSSWESFIANEDEISIGYEPTKKQLILLKTVADGAGSDYDGDIYIYDFATQSFCFGNSKFTDSVEKTNFINDWNGDLVLIHTDATGTCVKWDDSSDASATLELIFKDEVYSTAINRKTVHSIWLTHKGAGVDKAELWYRKIDASGLSSYVSLGNLTNSTDWIQQEFAINVDDAYSVQLKIVPVSGQTIASTFEINDIHDVYISKEPLG